MNRIPLRINRLNSLAALPDYQSDHAAGMDLHAALSEPVTIESGEIRLIPCGFAMAAEVARCEMQDVEELDTTVRGAGGFGSTGH